MAFHSIHWYSLAFQGISRHSKTFQGISRHSKTFQGIPRHSKAFLGLPRVIQGVPRGSKGGCPKSSKDVQSRPKTSKVIPKGSKGFQGFQVVPPVLEWSRGATHRDLHMGTYAFCGATPGDLRGLAALGAGRRPAAS